MRALRIASPLVVIALAAAMAGCGGDEGRADPGPPPDAATRSPADEAPGRAEAAPSDAEAPVPVTRSLQLAHVGWRFALDAAARGERTRIDVVVRTATVDAAPQRIALAIDGALVDAFATDLDGDAAPELLLWARGSGSSAEGEVLGWRFAADGSATPLALPALDDDAAIGWRGRDQFGVQGDALVRSFPLYRDEDDNASPSAGFVRVVRYRLGAEGLTVVDSALEPMDGTPQADVLAR